MTQRAANTRKAPSSTGDRQGDEAGRADRERGQEDHCGAQRARPVAANVVSPANASVNADPRRITFRTGGCITAGLGIAMMPWKLLESTQDYIYTWLIGYSALLGPIAGILIADYFVRRARLDLESLYRRDGCYAYVGGVNPVAMAALLLGVLPSLPGFLHEAGAVARVPAVFDELYRYAWFVGLLAAGVVYLAGMRRSRW